MLNRFGPESTRRPVVREPFGPRTDPATAWWRRAAGGPMRIRHAWVALALTLSAAAPLAAQAVRGRLVEAQSRAPVEGAMVWLLDADGARLGGALTDSAGWFIVRAPAAGRYRLRAERIGFATTTSPEVAFVAGETLAYELVASAEPIRLDAIEVETEQRCTVRPGAGLPAARLWEEARKALEAAAWSEDAGTYRFDVLDYQRELDAGTLRVRSERRVGRSLHSRNPIRSRPAAELASHGYIQPQSDGGWTLYAPDAEVLLSDPFLNGHCFRVVAGAGRNGGLAGLAFEPVRAADRPDITGVLWLDRTTAALRRLEIRYTRLPREMLGPPPRGRIEFERLPNGAWFVRRWWIRAPMIGLDPAAPQDRRVRTLGVHETGGEVVGAADAGGRRVVRAPRAALAGLVYDSTRAVPLAGAEVFLSGTQYRTAADSAGRFRLDDLPQGVFAASFLHPRLDSLGLFVPPREVALLPGDLVELRLAVPSTASLLAAACEAPEPGARTGAVVGTVRDAATGRPLAGARVTLRWSRFDIRGRNLPAVSHIPVVVHEDWEGVELETDERGGFRACGLPADTRIVAQAAHGEWMGPPRTIRLDRDGTLELRLEVEPARPPAGIVDRAGGRAAAGSYAIRRKRSRSMGELLLRASRGTAAPPPGPDDRAPGTAPARASPRRRARRSPRAA